METIYDFLAAHAHSNTDKKAFTFIEDSGEKSQLSFNELHQQALSIAQYLTTEFKSGSRVVLLFPPGLEYIQTFLGCLYAGVVAVPLYPPQSKKHAGRVLTVIDDCEANLVLTNSALKGQMETDLTPLPVMSFEQVVSSDSASFTADEFSPAEAEQVAFLQYTSGSTGTPKGVVISHNNIIANLKSLKQATSCSKDDVFCNWLPLFHDLGLVNTLLLPVYLGVHSVLMSPVRFIKNPMSWLNAITEFKATICGAPNFAFDHCIERIRPHQLAGIDLSSWRIAFNAAEPVDAETLLKFSERFSRVGFKESAIFPAYGMAEATVFICGGAHATAYSAYPFSNVALQKGEARISDDSEKQQILIAHGHVQAEHQLKIVSPETLKELSDGQVGEIWFAGPSLAQGYWNDAAKTEASFGARLEKDDNSYLRTGDLGFIHNGELYISGRIKDVLIIKGRNFYPQDFEKLAYSVCPGLSQNGAAAFEVNGSAVLQVEVSRNEIKEFDYNLACETIKTAIFEQFEVVVEEILFLKGGRINRTSSGKVQRSLTKKRYLADDLDYLFSSSKGRVLNGESAGETSPQNEPSVISVSELEAQLCSLWQQVLGVDSIGVEDDFLNLGGHSLLATTLVAQIQKKWNVEVSIRSFFTANTIRKLSKIIEAAAVSQLPEIKPVTNTDSTLPSFAQERMWFVNQIESEQAQYNLSFSLKLFGELNESFLQQAFTAILTRHQSLRTTFIEDEGVVCQRVQESFQFEIPTIDLTSFCKAQQESRVTELSQEEAIRHFNLAEDLMLRVTLLKLNAQSHIMLLTVHHIAADGWSLGVLSKELNALYTALTFGSENPLAQLDIQYIDYASWQRDWLKEDVLKNHLHYWKEQLTDLPVIHGFPLDNTRPAVQSFKGASVHFTLAKELHEELLNLARENEATLFMLLNAAFASFLSRYSGETDIVIGSPIANREQAEIAPLIGLFINNLVFRSDLSMDPSFVDLLQQSKERTFAAYEHQQMPFEKLVNELQPERNLSHSPLFQVMLTLQNQEMEPLNLPGVEVKQLKSCNTFAQYDLTLTLKKSDNGLEMEWQYATDLFSEATVERMIGHFKVLLESIIKSPATKVSQLSLISNDESSQLVKNWNNTAKSFPQEKCIHELFEAQVELYPNAVASIFNKEEMTYTQLNQRANQLARYLVEQGVKPDTVIGICVERSLEMLVGVLAIMKSGGAYLPMDPAYPKARLDYMVEDSGVNWVITQKHLNKRLGFENSICLDEESFSDELTQLEHSNLDKNDLELASNNLAYLIYTSGSTGKPKGVMLEHRNVTNFLSSMQAEPGMTKEDILLAVTSLSFDIHVLELYLPLIVGGCLVIASSDNIITPVELASLIENHQITTMQATPATWKMLVNNDWQPQNKIKALCGGEALNNDLKEKLLAIESIDLWNMYGPTETAVWSALQKIEDSISLGAPIANTQFYVLDTHLKPVPIGVAGELHIGGEGVSRGYLNQQELTEEKFIKDPFSDVESARIYKTGDLVRWLPDGTLEFLRRIDLQVKVRGHRIELGEIESGLQQHPYIQEAVVTVRIEDGTEYIVAYVTGKFSEKESELHEKLAEYLEAFLPAYMIPSAFVCLEKIPLTPNGKINRSALPKPKFSSATEYVAPETGTEKKLCEIWQKLLKLDVGEEKWISVSSNFFQLGGHSLLAARLVSQIRKHWNVELQIKTLFTEQTVRKLSKEIECASVSKIPEIVPVPTRESVPLSFAQKRLWFIDQIEEGRHQYNLCRGFKLSGALDLSTLTFAFKSIVERHEVLRTTYRNSGAGEAVQVVNSDFDIAIPIVDLTSVSEEKQEPSALEYIQVETNRVFDLSSDLMIRVKLLKFGSKSYALLVTIHHIALDGWSEKIIIDELNTLYRDKDTSLPALEIQYRDYAWWQNNWLQGDVLERHLPFWSERLLGLPEVHSLPLDRPRPSIQSYEGLKFNQLLSADIQQGLNALAKQHDATLFMVLNAAFAILLSRHSNEEDIVIGTPIANREQAELASVVGFFVNTMVLRTDLSNSPNFENLLKQCKEHLLASYEHQQLPFEKLIEELQPERSLSFSPLFQVMLVLQNNELGALELPGLSIEELKPTSAIARYDLTLTVAENIQSKEEEGINGLTLLWEYSTALFDASTIERMAGHFEVLLNGIIGSPQTAVGQISILTTEEEQQILKWNETEADYPQDKCIHQLFIEQVAINPDKIAVVFQDEELSYQQLYDKSHALALYLQSLGVKPDSLVGLCVERSLEMMVGILGILQAGGAYVPLDPDYPDNRLAYMLEDSQVAIVLSQEKLQEKLGALVEQKTKLIALDKQWSEISDSAADLKVKQVKLQQEVKSHHLAYVIYTSGSTGRAKGVAIEHHSSVALVYWAEGVYSGKELSGVLASTSISFDLSVYEIFLTLSNGGKIILAPNILGLANLSNKESITLINTVPSAMEELIRLKAIPDSVKTINLAGEPLLPTLVDKIYANSSVQKVYDLYGPSEDTTYSTFILREKNAPQTIGRPIDNTQIYILDQYNNPVSIGVPGELHIAGDGLARGYLNRLELTEEKFIPNPFNPGTRMYKSGDLARWLDDGNIEYLGRIDTQVKIRGFRIEMGEIEAQLNQYLEIKDSVAVAQGQQANKKLVAFYVASETTINKVVEFPNEDLRSYLQQTLPEYMLPATFVSLGVIPLTPNGKVDRRTLENMDVTIESEQVYLAPGNEMEKQLVAIWATVLKLDPDEIGVNDNFFELGGHSLLAVRLVSEIRSRFRVEITVGDLFRQPTIRELASLIQNAELATEQVLVKAPDNEPSNLSFAQQSLWLVDQINPGQTQYNIPMALQLEGELDIKAFNSAFESIIERHQTLRTVIRLSDSGEPIQKILQNIRFNIPVTDLSDLNAEEKEEAVLRYAEEETAIPFKLSSDLMIRARLLKLSQTSHVILLTKHHIASDGWSRGILLNEFSSLYSSFIGEETPGLTDLVIQYADYAWSQRQWLQGEVLKQQLGFWKEKLQGMPEVHNLPLDRARPVVQDNKGTIFHQVLGSDIQEGLRGIAQQNEVTMFMVLSAAYSILLSRYSGETDIVFGTPVANRDQVELTSLVGFFTNAIVIRTDLSDNPYFDDLLKRCKEYLLGAYEHQQLPFEKLVDQLQEQRNLSYSPLYQVKLALQNNELGEIDLPGLAINQLETNHSVALHDLSLDVYELEDGDKGLELRWEYATSLFDASTIERMSKHFEELLKGIIEKPQARISKLPCITAKEKKQLITWSKWSSKEGHSNTVSAADKKEQSVLDLFERQVANNPDNIAAMFEESAHCSERITYKELNAKANQVAHYLLEQGVTPDTLVGLCFERSLEMIIGIWGILKAGAAYVPIDPDYPEKHIEHILDDSAIEIILTSSELLSELPFDELQILPLDDEMWDGFLGEHSEENVELGTLGQSLGNLAYVIYTSGSTGLPKGVAVEHKALAQSTLSRFDVYQETPDSFALFSSFAFDSSIVGIFWTLVTGGKLCIVDIKKGLDLVAFQSLMTKEQVSHFLTLPSVYLSMLIADIQPGPAFKTVIVAGEACDQNLVKRHQSHAQWKNCRLFNEYGPTEACVWSSYYECTHHSYGIVPIGATVPHAELFVLDNELQHCPLGVTGELYVGGENLARGYLNAPALTKEKFITSPFNERHRLYKTGDLVRCMPDANGLPGNLEFIGRSDHQIKIRGFRIELGEVEAAIAKNESVSEAVVLAKAINSSQDSKQLVAYVVANKRNGETNDSEATFREELHTYLKRSLLSHKIPSVFVILEKLPLTPNGKIDRGVLQAKEVPKQLTHEYVAPKTKIEKQLCEIWQNLLKVKEVGITENFFAIGGDSILAIQAVTRAAKDGVVFTTRQLFECQTIEKLASQTTRKSQFLISKCEATRGKSQQRELTIRFEQWKLNQADEPLTKTSTEQMWRNFFAECATPRDFPLADVTQTQLDVWFKYYPSLQKLYPTTGMQQGMLYHSSLDAAAYVSQLSVMLSGRLDSAAFKLALDAIISRHDVFRTVFTDDYTHQLVLSVINLDFTEFNLSDYSESEQSERIEQFLKQDKKQGFDFKQAPLMRITLVELSQEKHCLIWSSHHALSDGWSFPLVFKEVITLYEEASRDDGQSSVSRLLSVLPEAQPYESYISWLQQQDDEKARCYWADALVNIETSTQINIDKINDGQSHGSRTQCLSLSEGKSIQLQSLARHHLVTLNTLVQAAWAYLLHRYTGKERVVFGETVSGRPTEIEGVEHMVGLFINSLPVPVNIEVNQEIGEWLRSLHKSRIDRVENGFLSLTEIQKLSSVGQATAQQEGKLFDTLVVFENYRVEQELDNIIASSELSIDDVKSNDQTNYGLTLLVLPEFSKLHGQLNFELGYQAECYKERSITRILEQLETVLTGFLDQSCKTVGELPILTSEEEHQILNNWNDTASDYPQDKCIHQLFMEQVSSNPEKIAVVFQDKTLSYQQLYDKSHDLALYLQSLGVKPDNLVGLCVERSLEMMIGLLGILQAGGAYVPLDPNYPDERLAYMLQDSQTTIVLTQEKLQNKLSNLIPKETQLIALDKQWSEISGCAADLNAKQVKLQKEVTPQHLVYMIYTSGSTGKPKGVMVEHRSLVNHMHWIINKFKLNEKKTILQKTSFNFDAAQWEFMVLTSGTKIVMAAPGIEKDPQELINVLIEHNITTLQCVPAFLKALLENNAFNQCSQLTDIFCGGETLNKSTIDECRQLLPNSNLYNIYGPTECTIDATAYDCSQLDDLTVPIGTPINNTQIYILDQHKNPQPIGVAGELHIAGDGLARGYYGRTELTQEKFIPNPFNPGTRMFKSGDLARWLGDGNIEFLGRIDTQVKIRGFRIEIGEIESQLIQHEEIKESAVVAQGQEGNKQLVAYYVANGMNEENILRLASDDLQAYLQQSLPEYMLPVAYVSLDKIPLTPNGKVDRRALEQMDVSPESIQVYLAPRNEIEEQLVAIWAEVLNQEPEKIGVNDNFFELGGHSLLVAQLVSKIRVQLAVDLPMRTLFEQNNIAGLAILITKAERSKIPAILPINRAELEVLDGNQLPLSLVQERLWFVDQLEPNNPSYNIFGAVTITGEIEIDHLDQAFNLIIERHEILRTVFPSYNGQAQQCILDSLDFSLQYIDVGHYESNESRHEKAQQLCQNEAATPFDLAKGPLIRGQIIRLGAQEHILSLTMHHIITDEKSTGILIDELGLIMKRLGQGQSPDLVPLPIQYLDYSIWQRKLLNDSGLLQEQLNYWQEKLAGVPECLDLATDYPRPSVQDSSGATSQLFRLDKQLSSQLQNLAEQQGCTLFMTLLAVFNTLYYRYTGQEDICLGSPIANRQQEETEDLIGMFVNTIALRNQVEGESSFIDLLALVKTTCLEAYDHQDAPFEKVVELVQSERDMSTSPLFQIVFILHNEPVESPEQNIHSYPIESNFSRFDQIINMTKTSEGLEGFISYRTALYKPETIERVVKHFIALCKAITTTPIAKINELEFIGEAEKQQLLIDYNDTQAEYPKDKCIHQLFTEQLAVNPDKTAVVQVGFSDEAGSTLLSYQQLNDKSYELALFLQSLGVKPDSLVGLCVDRSLEMMVGILGILQAGGAYVPLDPEYPDDRLSYMLEDSQATVVLTTSIYKDKLKALGNKNFELIVLDEQGDLAPDFKAEIKSKNLKLRKEVKPDNLAYVIYTSGSTGQPKGVMIEHGMVIDYCYSVFKKMDLHHCDTFASVSTVSADLGNIALYVPIMFSKTIYLFSNHFVHHPIRLKEYLDNHPLDCMKITPSHFEMFKLSDTEIVAPSKVLIFAGEPLTKKMVETVNILKPSCKVFNNYGPTETTISKLSTAELKSSEISSINLGKPLNNTQIYILDRYNQPQPIGVPGELHIAGDGVARGYFNRSELTEEKFISNPFKPGTHMYRSGDLARWLDDGNIEYLGRIDQQVKIRGFRIELNEIEAQLNLCPGIKDSAVVVQGQEATKQLIAFYVDSNTEKTMTSDELKEHLLQTLPEYMLPLAFICLEAIPLTLNGKIDRIALGRMDVTIESNENYAKPRNETEKKLVELWEEVLEMEPGKIGINDNFFELGGHSLLAIMLVSKAVDHEIYFEIRDMFNHPSIRDLMDNCEIEDAREIIREEGILEDSVALSPIQSYFFDRVKTNVHHFNQSVLLNLHASLSVNDLQELVTFLVKQHDALRLRYTKSDNAWQQYYLGSDALSSDMLGLQTYDIDHLEEKQVSAYVEEICDQWQASLDIENGPVMRWVYFNAKGKGSDQLAVIIHHLMVDTVSWHILLEDLNQLIGQRLTNQELVLSQKRSSYRDWVNSLSEYKDSTESEQELVFWVEQSQKTQHIKNAFSDKAYQNKDIAPTRVSLSESNTEKLLRHCNQAYGTDINDLLLTAVMLSYQMTTGSKELMIEMEGHGRDQINPDIDITKTVGWFTSIYPVYFGLSNPEDIGQCVKDIKTSLHAIPNKGVGFSIFYHVNQHEEIRNINTPQVKFNYTGEVGSNTAESTSHHIEFSQHSSGRAHSGETEIDRLVTINGATESGRLSFNFNYPREWQGQQISHWQTHFVTALEALIEHCYDSLRLGYTPSDFPLLNASPSQLEKITQDLKVQQNITLDNIQDIYPLSPLQLGILFETLYARTEENKGMYLQQFAFAIKGRADTQALQQAWQSVASHYDALRTQIITTDLANIDTNLQVVLKQVDLQISRIDCAEKTHAELKPVCEQWMIQSKRSGINLDRAPLARVSLLQGHESCYMVFEQHHIVTDGWSKNIVLSNVFKLYLALVQQQDYQLPPTAPYKALIQALLNRDLEEEALYWKKYLINYEERTPLPMSDLGPRRGIVKEHFDKSAFSLSEENSIKLDQLVKKHGLTMNNVLQFIWGLLLHLQSGNKTVVFGSVSSGRSGILEAKHGDQMVGLCINTVPTCIQFDANLSLMEHLKRKQSRESEKLNYESTPLVFIQELLGIKTNEHFFQSLFVYESYPVDEESATTSMFIDTIDDTTPNYPLSLIIEPREKLSIGFEYDNYYYSKETIETLIGQFERLVRQLIAAPESTIKEVSLISAQEKQQLLIDYNNTQADYPHDKSIHQLFMEQVSCNPDKIAVVFQDKTLSYQQLYDKSHDLALYLQSLGVKPDSLVGLCVERSLEMMVGLLGILQAGGAYVPLDPEYPDERLAYMLEDTQVAIVLTQEKLKNKLKDLIPKESQLIALDKQLSEINDCASDMRASGVTLNQNVTSEHLAYVIYTSGSTGQPKGVMVAHKAVNRLVINTNFIKISEDDSFLQFASLSFDAATFEIWGALLNGGKLVIAPHGKEAIERLEELINTWNVSVLWLTSGLFQLLVKENVEQLSNIRVLLSGGDVVPVDTTKRFLENCKDTIFVNGYGPTENTTFASCFVVSEGLDKALNSLPIGSPIANTQVYILDQYNKPAPVGVPGEIHIAGDGLARGYLNNPELTETKFIPNPFNPGTRMYKSGDMARWLDGGCIEFIGRVDNQIKIRGFRIEAGEIETRLNQYPAIKDSVIVAQGQEGNKQLIAFYVTNLTVEGKGIELDHETLKGYLQQSLPNYMLPTVFNCLAAIPLTINGKVDLRALEQMDVHLGSNQTYLAPRNDMERQLTDIWAEVLNFEPEKIGMNDNFFELGGHSLNATQILPKIRNQLAIDLPMAALFEFSTIAGLVEFIQAAQYRYEPSKDEHNGEQIDFEEGSI